VCVFVWLLFLIGFWVFCLLLCGTVWFLFLLLCKIMEHLFRVDSFFDPTFDFKRVCLCYVTHSWSLSDWTLPSF
jgi:hypothetical protein